MTTKKTDPRILAGTVIACVGIVVVGACAVFMSDDKWHDVGRFLSSAPGEGTVAGMLIFGVGAWVRARWTPAALVLLAALSATTLSGCTPSQWAAVQDVAKPVGKWGCLIARALCTKADEVACGVIAGVCEGVDALIGEHASTSGGEAVEETEPHTIDGEDEQ